MNIHGLKKLPQMLRLALRIPNRLDSIQQAIGRIEARQIVAAGIDNPKEAEFRVSSQWGEDGIIQFLVQRIPIQNKVFIEFGVQDYTESNTRYLLQNNNWAGLVMDGDPANIKSIVGDPVYWRFNLKALCAFIDRDKINDLILNQGIKGDIGLLSIDIDGNDYWVWEAIDCVQPRIVIVEYNSLFGPTARVTVPYDPKFIRTRAHYSNLFWGASIAALHDLGQRKGYSLVASNTAGNNVFFVHNDLLLGIPTLTSEEAYVPNQWRDSRDRAGNLNFLDHSRALAEISDLLIFDLNTSALVKVGDVCR